MDNYIQRDNGDTIGYYSDLTRFNKEEIKKAVELNDWESTEMFIGIQKDLDYYTDYDGLLVISDCIGMGYRVMRYKEDYKEI